MHPAARGPDGTRCRHAVPRVQLPVPRHGGGGGGGVRVHLLGGAAEIGASCVVVEAGGRRVLVDAGVRPGDPDPLPDLARLQDLGGVSAIVVSHAHADHIGALPLAAAAFPAAPLLATPPTAALMAVMLQDALRIAEARLERDGDLPAYGEPAVAALLDRLRPLPFLQPYPLLPPDGAAPPWQLTFFPAGHVLGAALVLLETPEGTVLVSGDLSLARQRTVGPATSPRRRLAALVLESTYGNRLHSRRAAEEARLVAQVGAVLGRGGHCLIPAFALGRAQEVLMILADARRRGLLPPETPVWVDGLVRAVCGVYTAHGASGSPGLRRLLLRQDHPFFHGPTRPVRKPAERAALLAGPPAVIVSSSGMLTGGPSAFYAARLAPEPRHAILITGYQDEEAPGRRLLVLAAQPQAARRLTLDGADVAVACEVARYNLSAHADGDELAAVAERLQPGLTLLVHGDAPARQALGEKLAARGLRCRLPDNGETVDLPGHGGRRVALVSRPAPDGAALAASVRGLPTRSWSPLDLASRYYGAAEAGGVDAVRTALEAGGAPWQPDPLRPGFYQPRPPAPAGDAPPGDAPWGDAGSEQEWVRRLVEAAFAGDPSLLRAGLHVAARRVELRFPFPAVARVRHADRLAELAARTGWRVELRPQPDLGALQAAALAHLPAGLAALARPGLRPELGSVALRVRGAAGPAALQAAAAAFHAQTGFALDLLGPDGQPLSAPAAAPEAGSRREINAAFAAVRAALEAEGHTVYRVGRSGASIEVALLTPALGRRCAATLERLASELGWPVHCARHPQQQELFELVRRIVDAPLARGPGVQPLAERVTLRLPPGAAVDPARLASWRDAVLAASGYTLEVTEG